MKIKTFLLPIVLFFTLTISCNEENSTEPQNENDVRLFEHQVYGKIIVDKYHGPEKADHAETIFIGKFSTNKGPVREVLELDEDMKLRKIIEWADGQYYNENLSGNAIKTLIKSGSVKVDGEKITDISYGLKLGRNEVIIEYGKKKHSFILKNVEKT